MKVVRIELNMSLRRLLSASSRRPIISAYRRILLSTCCRSLRDALNQYPSTSVTSGSARTLLSSIHGHDALPSLVGGGSTTGTSPSATAYLRRSSYLPSPAFVSSKL